MDTLKLGQIIEPDRIAERDATHIAVAPVVAGMCLMPGSRVLLADDKAMQTTRQGIGVVDPYLKITVEKGERFWLFLYPGTITGLRHQWEHPAFAQKQAQDAPRVLTPALESRAFLENVAMRCGVDYDSMMGCMEDDDYINMGENEGYKGVLESLPEGYLEHHFEIVTGKKPKTTYPFSCSC